MAIGGVYLAAIPLFAALYTWWLPADFVHTTAQYEPLFQNAVRDSLPDLTELADEWLSALPRDQVALESTVISRVEPTPTGISFRAQFPCFVKTAETRSPSGPPLNDTLTALRPDVEFDITVPNVPPREIWHQTLGYRVSVPAHLTRIPNGLVLALPHVNEGEYVTWGSVFGHVSFVNDRQALVEEAVIDGKLAMKASTYERLFALYAAGRGHPPGAGSYARFLYFSAITLTTTGFGDILPISNRARLSVTAESVFGVVCIGLFLNSLAMRISRSRAA
jgi:hypothetical protein